MSSWETCQECGEVFASFDGELACPRCVTSARLSVNMRWNVAKHALNTTYSNTLITDTRYIITEYSAFKFAQKFMLHSHQYGTEFSTSHGEFSSIDAAKQRAQAIEAKLRGL